jgi:hypothetical protein
MMDRARIFPATLEADLAIEDHGLLTMYVACRDEHSTYPFEVYGFDYHKDGQRWTDKGFTAAAIRLLMETVGVHTWRQVTGQLVRCRLNDSGRAVAIGHIIKERWWNLTDIVQEYAHPECRE